MLSLDSRALKLMEAYVFDIIWNHLHHSAKQHALLGSVVWVKTGTEKLRSCNVPVPLSLAPSDIILSKTMFHDKYH